MDENKSAHSTYVDNLSLSETIMHGAGYSAKGLGIFISSLPVVVAYNKSDVSFDGSLVPLGFGIFLYLIGHGIHSVQAKIQTYKKLDNIEKLLIEQNKTLKGE